MRGMGNDISKRAPLYWSDWRDGLHYKIIGSILYMYFTSIGPAVTFGAFLAKETKNQIGVVEVLLSTAVTGVLFSIITGMILSSLRAIISAKSAEYSHYGK